MDQPSKIPQRVNSLSDVHCFAFGPKLTYLACLGPLRIWLEWPGEANGWKLRRLIPTPDERRLDALFQPGERQVWLGLKLSGALE